MMEVPSLGDERSLVKAGDTCVFGSDLIEKRPILLVITVPVPVKEANQAERFVQSRLKDIEKHFELDALRLVRKDAVPKGTKVVGVRFADFDRYEDQECIEQKSRVAAKGCQQQKGRDCGPTSMPTPDEYALRCFFAVATLQRIRLENGDDVSAFLKARRESPVYIRLPGLYNPKGYLYDAWAGVNGLRDSANLYWNGCVTPFYESIGMLANPYDPCVFMKID